MKEKIAVIGAGMAGLTAADQLRSKFDVTVFEKSRGVGGRLASRRHDALSVDMGAQFFTVKHPAFAVFVSKLESQGIVKLWQPNFVEIVGTKIVLQRQWSKQPAHYVAVPKMTQMAKFLAQSLTVLTQYEVTKVVYDEKDKQWQLFSKEQPLGRFAKVIFAMPPAQVFTLLPACCAFKQQLASKQMLGCYALMLEVETLPETQWQAALLRENILSWVSMNGTKPGRSGNTIVALASNQWAERHMERDIAWVSQELLAALSELLPGNLNNLLWQDCQRWRYANIGKQLGEDCFVDLRNQLYAAGDWCIQGRVEAAYLSGLRLARIITAA